MDLTIPPPVSLVLVLVAPPLVLAATACLWCGVAEWVIRIAAWLYTGDPIRRAKTRETWLAFVQDMSYKERPGHAGSVLWLGLRHLPTRTRWRRGQWKVARHVPLPGHDAGPVIVHVHCSCGRKLVHALAPPIPGAMRILGLQREQRLAAIAATARMDGGVDLATLASGTRRPWVSLDLFNLGPVMNPYPQDPPTLNICSLDFTTYEADCDCGLSWRLSARTLAKLITSGLEDAGQRQLHAVQLRRSRRQRWVRSWKPWRPSS